LLERNERVVLAAFATLIIFLTALLSTVTAYQLSYVTLQSGGTTQQPVARYGPSEIRGIFVKWLDAGTTWETLAASYEPYRVNWLVGEAFGTYFSRSNLDSLNIHNQAYDYIGEGIKAAHAHKMKFTAMMLVGYRGPEVGAPDPAIDVVDENGNLQLWTCPLKAKDLILSIVSEVAAKYPGLDGFMFDYIRYSNDYGTSMCYCEYCHQRFIADTGLTDVVWRTDVIPGGRYYAQWLEWRVKPITELVRDVRAAMLAFNPKLEFSIAALSLWYENGVGYGSPIRQWFGQDVATMVSEGYIDVVCPMQYTADLSLMAGVIDTNSRYLVGGTEGKVPLVPVIGGLEGKAGDITPAQVASVVALLREKGTDGFLVYRQIQGFVSKYLSQIPNNPAFTISYFQPYRTLGNVTFTWTTSAATSSFFEYSTSPLFYTQAAVNNGFRYFEVTHSAATVSVQNGELTITHFATIPVNSTAPIYFRVQSADANNVLSSPQLVYNP
jgi:hypothetical protein